MKLAFGNCGEPRGPGAAHAAAARKIVFCLLPRLKIIARICKHCAMLRW
jgi:hypothetical protein